MYHYDVDADANPSEYNSRNNRLMWYETIDTASTPEVTLSKTYYVYTYDSTYGTRAGRTDGNPTRIITEQVAQSAASGAEAGRRGLRGGNRPAFKAREAQEERAGDSSAGSTAAACGAGETQYTATRFGYAANGRAVAFVHDESWCWDGVSACPTQYTISAAREFRYDGARARYMNRKLDPVALQGGTLTDLGTIWTDYDGDATYGDFTITPGSPPTVTSTDQYQPGLWRTVAETADYLHGDMLGTLRQTSGSSGLGSASDVFTAFGERIAGANDRFGYVGAWGYQSTLDSGAEVFPFLHLGHRYYDPSSGRFLQRDPVGIRGGSNVYGYTRAQPVTRIDPLGLWDWEKAGVLAICGAVTGSRFPGLIGTLVGAGVGLVGGGYESGDAGDLWDWLTTPPGPSDEKPNLSILIGSLVPLPLPGW